MLSPHHKICVRFQYRQCHRLEKADMVRLWSHLFEAPHSHRRLQLQHPSILSSACRFDLTLTPTHKGASEYDLTNQHMCYRCSITVSSCLSRSTDPTLFLGSHLLVSDLPPFSTVKPSTSN